MFELLEDEEKGTFWQHIRYLLISLATHAAVLLLCLAIPLVYFRVSSEDELLAFLIKPPEPPYVTAPPPPPLVSFFGRAIRTIGAPRIMPAYVAPPSNEPSPIANIRNFFPGRGWEIGKLAAWPADVSTPFLNPAVPVEPKAPPPPPLRRTPIRVGGHVQEAKLLDKIMPLYPEVARAARLSGVVILQALIDEEGRIESVEVLQGHPILVDSAVSAIKRWRYSPTLLNGEPLPVMASITVIFALKETAE